MKTASVIKYRNLFILVATFCILCISPLADVHFEGNTDTRSYNHGQKHNETNFSMLIHELLFTHLQHTFDHVTLGVSLQTFKKSKNLTSKGTAFLSYTQSIFASNSQPISVHCSTPIKYLHKNERKAGIYSRELSGLSPPSIFT